MAITSGFAFTNATATTHKAVSLLDLDENNYSLPKRVGENELRYENLTDGSTLTSEVIRVRTQTGGKVDTVLNVENPTKATSSRIFSVTLEDMLITTDTVDPTYEVDNPIVAKLSIAIPRDKNITASHVNTVINRLLSLFQDTSGSSKVASLMQGGLELGDF